MRFKILYGEQLSFDPMVEAHGRRTVVVRFDGEVVGNLHREGNGRIGRRWLPGWRANDLLLRNWPELKWRRGTLPSMKQIVRMIADGHDRLPDSGYPPKWRYRNGAVEAFA